MEPITRFALNNQPFAAVVLIGIILGGFMTLVGFPSQEDPEITIREAVVTAAFPGMAPERVENLITRPIEEGLREIPEIKDIRSTSKTGVSVVHVTVYDRYFDLAPIWQDVRNKMRALQNDLPEGTRGPSVNDEFGSVSIATVALRGDGFSLEEMRDAARDVRNGLYAVPGIAKVDLYGVQVERVYLEVRNARLAELGLTPFQLLQTLQNQNVILPGGSVEAFGEIVVIEPSGNFESVQSIADTVIEIPNTGEVTYLRDFATIERAFVDPPDRPAYYNGDPAIILSIQMTEGKDIVGLGERLTQRIHDLENTLPIGYTLDFATFQPAQVESSINDFGINLLETLGIVLAVVLLFLGIRTGLIVGLIVPTTMLAGIILMRQLDLLLQSVSIAAMIIALGLLVDNGIVIAEDIRRRLGEGTPRRDAALPAGRELSIPLLTSSLTTVLAFLPLLLAENVSGEFVRSLAQVLTLVLLSSWLIAIYVTPLLCYWFVRAPAANSDQGSARNGAFYRFYRALLSAILRFRWPFLAANIGVLVVAFWAFGFVPQQFFPKSERAQFLVYFNLVNGASSRETDRVVRQFSDWLGDKEINPEIVNHVSYVGDGGPRFYLTLTPVDPDTHVAFILVNTTDDADRAALMQRTRAYILENLPEVRPEVKELSRGPSEEGLVEFRISGPDGNELLSAADQLRAGFRTIPGTVGIKDDWGNLVKKFVVEVDQARARRAGVTSEEIAAALNSFLSGAQVTSYREGDQSIPVILRGDEDERFNLDRVRTLNVYSSARGTTVPLLQVATFRPVFQFGQIQRRNLERTITVSAKNTRLYAAELADAMKPTLASIDLPRGYRVEIGGEIEKSAESQAALSANMPVALAGILLLLVLQFRSIRKPLIIVITVPLAMIGAIVGLLAMGATFGFMETLGFLSLAGIIINNAIVLLDRIEIELAAGRPPDDAVIQAGVMRLRPILMTTLTTILGLLPLILFGGDLWYGIASAIAWGLGIGTIMTLGVVPALYAIFYRVPGPLAANELPNV